VSISIAEVQQTDPDRADVIDRVVVGRRVNSDSRVAFEGLQRARR
jgi:hypothetical protein